MSDVCEFCGEEIPTCLDCGCPCPMCESVHEEGICTPEEERE